jgi:hypothetical protein
MPGEAPGLHVKCHMLTFYENDPPAQGLYNVELMVGCVHSPSFRWWTNGEAGINAPPNDGISAYVSVAGLWASLCPQSLRDF